MSVTVLAAASVIASAIAAFGAYIAASRKLSGKIATSEAGQLWQESQSIREDYRERISTSDRRTLRLEERVAGLERDNNGLARSNMALDAKNTAYAQIIEDLRVRIDALEQENTDLKAEVVSLRESLRQERE